MACACILHSACLSPQVGVFASATAQGYLSLPRSFNCHSNTVITSSFFTANEKVKYECLTSTIISNSSSVPARAEHRLISTWKTLVNYAVYPQTTCTSVSVQLWSQIRSLELFHSPHSGSKMPQNTWAQTPCYLII